LTAIELTSFVAKDCYQASQIEKYEICLRGKMPNLKSLLLALFRSRRVVAGIGFLAIVVMVSGYLFNDDQDQTKELETAQTLENVDEPATTPTDLAAAKTGIKVQSSNNDTNGNPVVGFEPEDASQVTVEGSAGQSNSSVSPSFNCTMASIQAEQMVCSSRELALLDVELSEIYQKAVVGAKKYDQAYGAKSSQLNYLELIQSQAKWIRSKRNACRSEECMISAYSERIAFLRAF
jgi:uncharacterized protein